MDPKNVRCKPVDRAMCLEPCLTQVIRQGFFLDQLALAMAGSLEVLSRQAFYNFAANHWKCRLSALAKGNRLPVKFALLLAFLEPNARP